MPEFNPMTDVGIYTYKNMFIPDDSKLNIGNQQHKAIFKEENFLATYPPGIHRVEKNANNIKYFETFSSVDIDVSYTPKGYPDHSDLINKRVYKDKCYYDPIVTFVDTNKKYYTYNYESNLENDIVIELIIIQISHFPFENNFIQKYNITPKYEHAYENIGSYDCEGQLKKHDRTVKSIHRDCWQIHVKTEKSGKNQFNVYVWYDSNRTTEFDHTLYFYSSVFYLPAYLTNDKNYSISIIYPSMDMVVYKKIDVTPNADLPVFKITVIRVIIYGTIIQCIFLITNTYLKLKIKKREDKFLMIEDFCINLKVIVQH